MDMLAGRQLRKTGQKRGTQYYTKGSGATKAPTRKKATTRKKAGRRKQN